LYIDSSSDPPEWTQFNRDDFNEFFKCKDYYKRVLPIRNQDAWHFCMRRMEKWLVSKILAFLLFLETTDSWRKFTKPTVQGVVEDCLQGYSFQKEC
jgi:hypothetical protein